MKLQGDTTSMRVEPFAVVIRCTSAPDKVDGKTRSKWSRARIREDSMKRCDAMIDAGRRKFLTGAGVVDDCNKTLFLRHCQPPMSRSAQMNRGPRATGQLFHGGQ
jgi:hypothetical protein